jgi:hypothetical protein
MFQGVGFLVAALVGMAPGLRPEVKAQDEFPPPIIFDEPPTVVVGAARPHLKCYTMNVDTIKRPKGHKKQRDITIRDQFTRIAVPTELWDDPPLFFCEPMNKSTNPNKPPETDPVMLPSACYKAKLGGTVKGDFHFRDQFFPSKRRQFTNKETFFCDPVKAKLRVDMDPFTEDHVLEVLPPLFCYNFAKDVPVLQDVSATDQWRELGNIRIGKAINLCEPAVKNGSGEVPLPGDQPWICYEMGIAGKKPGSAKDAPILDKRVGWQDQFNVRAGLLQRPKLLCTPAEKRTTPFPEENGPED